MSMLIGNHTKDEEHQESFLIGSYSHQNTKFLFIREKTFTLTPCLLEEFGSSTISQLFRKCLMSVWHGEKAHSIEKFCTLENSPYQHSFGTLFFCVQCSVPPQESLPQLIPMPPRLSILHNAEQFMNRNVAGV